MREELTHTDPFVFINALHSLKDYLTWQIEKTVSSFTEMACRSGCRPFKNSTDS